MLVSNHCLHDARVIREAEALAEAGHTMAVLAHMAPDTTALTEQNGVEFHRVRVLYMRNKATGDIAGEATDKRDEQVGLAKFTRQITVLRNWLVRAAKTTIMTCLTNTALQLVYHAVLYTKRAVAMKPDVVHAHDLYTLLAGYNIARKTGAKLVYDSHELEVGRNGNFSRWELWLRARSEKFLIAKADAVITVCDSIANYLRDLYEIRRPVVVLNAPQSQPVQSSKKHIRSHLGLSKATPLAIYIGSVTINRGLENCVHALVHAKELHLALIGPRVEFMQQLLVTEAKKLGVQDRLHLVDPVPHQELVGFVKSADVSLITIQNVCLSYKFCFPNKLLESLFAGVPVVVARLVELQRVVEETSAGIVVDETDPRAIAEGAMQICLERDKYAPGAQKIKRLQKKYGWSTQCEKLVDLYERLQT